ncbi:argininosuccinate lyase [Acerihabitans sp. KWT182]|uniref:Argininosuccinate lyase n=1 Tax=Acerihabitans sp. KWT182 TaxID=3157919 RepID=A0AAU7Q5X5_9GAMM
MSTDKIGARLAQDPIREIQEFIYRPLLANTNPADFHDMLAVNGAHLVMLEECGLMTPERAAILARALLAMEEEGVEDPQSIDPRTEDAYFAFELRLGRAVGAHEAGFLHVARSRNDIGATLDRLRAARLALQIMSALNAVRGACLEKADAYAAVVMPGYTHLQPAQPITFGYLLAGYAEALQRDYQRLAETWPRIMQGSLGVAALSGSSFAIDRERTAALLGFEGVTRNGLDTVASRDFATELLYASAQLAVTWSRVVQDFHTFTSDEFSIIGFPDSVAGTSSIMPQKKNPFALEFLRAESARILGTLTGALSAIRSTHFTVSLDAIREGLTDLWPALARTVQNLELFKQVIANVQPRPELMLQRCLRNFSTATELADMLVKHQGLSFREAHHVVGQVVRLALEAGKTANEVDAAMVNRAAQDILGKELSIDDDFVSAALDPIGAVQRRNFAGGTGPDILCQTIASARRQLEQDGRALELRRQQGVRANAALRSMLTALAAR